MCIIGLKELGLKNNRQNFKVNPVIFPCWCTAACSSRKDEVVLCNLVEIASR